MSVRRASPLTVTFAAIDPVNRPARESGVSWSVGDVRISKDGGAFANATNLPTEIAAGRYALALTAAEMDAAWVHVLVTNAAIDDADLMIGTSGDPSGTVVSNAGNTAATFKTDRAEATADHWKNALLVLTTGALAGQVAKVQAYDGATKFVTLASSLTAAPAAGDRFRLLND